MSLINQVLQDLDQRNALSAADGTLPPQQVRAIPAPLPDREWFWGVVALLMVAALCWVGWVAYQLQPKSVATELAFKADEEARQHAEQAPIAASQQPAQVPTADKPAAPASSPETQKPASPSIEAAASVAEPPKPPTVPLEVFKLASSIETPITQRAPAENASQVETLVPPPVKNRPTAVRAVLKPPAEALPRLEKREMPSTSAEKAESEFRRAAALLNQGRISEAEAGLTAALALDPAHETARQSLVAVLIENRRFDEASRLLQDGLASNPANARFAMVLARIHAERGDNALALEVLEKAKGSAQGDAEFNPLLGAILQRLSRHEEAAQAYRAAVQAVPQSGISWVGLGISLEALQRRAEAGDAFRRAVATGSLNADVKTYAEQRARQLH
jgi:MSHA biogenesis protein MshN